MSAPADDPAFLAPILLRPADDGPRLVLADALDASPDPAGRARGEFIRVQCALARLAADHPRRAELAAREAELLAAHRPAWAAPLAGLAAGAEFRRGLLDGVVTDAAAFLAHAGELFRRTAVPAGGRSLPLVRRVRLRNADGVAADLAGCPSLARVADLDLCGNGLGNGGVHVLLRSPHLTAVERLDLSFNGLDDGAARLLAGAATLPRLRWLHLNDNGGITGDGVRALAAAPHLAGLVALDLGGNDVDGGGVAALVRSRVFGRLHTVRLATNRVGDDGAAALAGSELFRRTLDRDPRLDLRSNGIGPAGAAALAASPHLGRAASLELAGNHLGDAGVAALAASPHLGRLRRLGLAHNHVGDDGAAAVARSPLAARLRFLDLSRNRITRWGLDRLHEAKHPTAAFELSGNTGNAALLRTDGPPTGLDPNFEPALDELLDQLIDLRRRVSHPSRGGPPRRP